MVGSSTIIMKNLLSLENILQIDGLKNNQLSISQLCDKDLKFEIPKK